MTGLQLWALAGGLIGLGLAVLLRRLAPARPDLGSALQQLAPELSLAPSVPVTAVTPGGVDRVGAWASRRLPMTAAPVKDLALLEIPVSRFYGQKVLYALFGLAFPVVLGYAATLLDLSPPILLPAVASLVLAVVLSLLPDYNVRSDAAAAREEFTRALSAYVDLVALERLAGAGPRQAMESAAQIGDAWPFRRIDEELTRSRWSGVPPWDALSRLAASLDLTALADLADIMRLSGEEGASVYQSLRARSSAIRTALVTEELARANRAGERLTLPAAVLALTFAVLLTGPALIRLLLGPTG